MKSKKYLIILAAVALAVTAFGILPVWLPDVFASSFAFPFEQIGGLLSLLAGSGRAGNGLAFLIVGVLSVLPLLLPCIFTRVRRDKMLCVFCAVLSAVLAAGYFFILRPDLFQRHETLVLTGYQTLYYAMAGGFMWSGIIAFFTALVISLIRHGDTRRLLGYGTYALYAVGGALAASAAVPVISIFLSADGWDEIAESIVCPIISAIPTVVTVFTVCLAGRMLIAYSTGDEENILPIARRLSRLCQTSLLLTVGASIVKNIVPFAFGKLFRNVAVNVEIPLLELAVSISVLLAVRLIERNRTLQQDNDLFI